MNIIEYLRTAIFTTLYEMDSDVDTVLNEMEMEIREGIAQELEDLVGADRPVKSWGVPTSAHVFARSVALTQLDPNMQQEYFRGAANCVRGRHLATDDEWADQAEAMKMRVLETFTVLYPSLPDYSDEGLSKADVRNVITAYEMERSRQAQLAIEQEKKEERLREWNS